MSELLNGQRSAPGTLPLPPVDDYWNPGEPGPRYRARLAALHQVSKLGGMLRQMLGTRITNAVGVLTYHRISPVCRGLPEPTINVTPVRFRRQIVGLLRRGFRFISLQEALDAQAQGREFLESTVVLTFDDIYDNVYEHAFPILQELEIPATCFVASGFIDSEAPFLFDPWARAHHDRVPRSAWRPITGRHLRKMVNSGLVEIGAHSHTHRDFRLCPDAFCKDVMHGVRVLADSFGAEPSVFAFPYGAPQLGFCCEQWHKELYEHGFRCGLTTASHTNRLSDSPFGWGRFHVFDHDTAGSLAAKLDGWYEWLPNLRRRLLNHS